LSINGDAGVITPVRKTNNVGNGGPGHPRLACSSEIPDYLYVYLELENNNNDFYLMPDDLPEMYLAAELQHDGGKEIVWINDSPLVFFLNSDLACEFGDVDDANPDLNIPLFYTGVGVPGSLIESLLPECTPLTTVNVVFKLVTYSNSDIIEYPSNNFWRCMELNNLDLQYNQVVCAYGPCDEDDDGGENGGGTDNDGERNDKENDDDRGNEIDPRAVSNFDLKIYPNPVRSELKLSGINSNSKINILITDLAGQLVYESNEFNYAINTDFLKNGIYFIRIKNGDAIIVDKFSKI